MFRCLKDILENIVIPCIGLVILILNLVVIFYIIRYRKSQHNPIATVYCLNMAFGDFFVGLAVIVVKVTDITLEHATDGDFKLWYIVIRDGVIQLSLFISVLNLIPLTIDRVWAVRYPISHRQSKKALAIKICVAVWFVGVIFIALFYCIVYFQNANHNGLNKMIFPLVTYPTTLIFIVCYIVIFRELRNSRRYRQRSGSRSVNPMNHVVNQLTLESRSSSVTSLTKFDEKKNEVRFVQLAVKTVVVFIFCWFPIATCGMVNCEKNVEATFMVFGYLNAAVTPLVYYSHLRQALQRKIRRLTSRKQPLHKSPCTIFNSNIALTPKKVSHQNIIAGVENNKLSVSRSL